MDMLNAQPPHRAEPFDRLLIKVAGVDEETLRLCPQHDWDNVRAVGEIMICTWLYQAALFSVISHRLFAASGQIRPELVMVSMFIATFIMAINSYMVMRSGWHLSGIEFLKRGGLDISGGPAARLKAGFFLMIRILLSVGLAQLTAIFLSLLIFASDIDARIQSTWRQANAHLLVGASEPVDAEIQRATDAVTEQTARVTALSAQVGSLRQNEIDPSAAYTQAAQEELTQLLAQKAKADDELRAAEAFAANELAGIKAAPGNSGQVGNGPKRKAAMEQIANARNHAQESARALEAARARLDTLRSQHGSTNEAMKQQSHDQLPTFEKTLAAENARLTAMKDELARLTQGRGDAIRAALDKMPNHVRRDDGLLAQITVLELIAQGDSKIAAVIVLIDVISFGFELAAVLAKVTSYVPTTYAALLARDAYLRVVRMVDEMMVELKDGATSKNREAEILPPDLPADDERGHNGASTGPNPFDNPDDDSPQPPKRPRGRPRKTPLNGEAINSRGREVTISQP